MKNRNKLTEYWLHSNGILSRSTVGVTALNTQRVSKTKYYELKKIRKEVIKKNGCYINKNNEVFI